MKNNLRYYAMALVMTLSLAGKSQATTVVDDNFSGGTATDPVAGRTEPVSGATYYGSMDYMGDPSFAASLNGQDDLGLPFDLASYSADGSVVTLNVDYNDAYNDGIFQTGFARNVSTLSINGVLYFQYAAGSGQTYELIDDGTNVLASGSIDLDTGTGLHDIQLTYNTTGQTASLSVDGTVLVNDISTAGNFSDPITAIYSYSNYNASEIHGLQVDVTAAPEPTTSNLLLIGAAASFGLLWMRKRSFQI